MWAKRTLEKGFLGDVSKSQLIKPSLSERYVEVSQAEREGKSFAETGSQPLARMEFISLVEWQGDRTAGAQRARRRGAGVGARGRISQGTLPCPCTAGFGL